MFNILLVLAYIVFMLPDTYTQRTRTRAHTRTHTKCRKKFSEILLVYPTTQIYGMLEFCKLY